MAYGKDSVTGLNYFGGPLFDGNFRRRCGRFFACGFGSSFFCYFSRLKLKPDCAVFLYDQAGFEKALGDRDISKGNLMMTEQQGLSDGPWGVLNDWDRAGKVGDKVGSRTVSAPIVFV